jgi:hypothetical protein
MPSQDKKGHSHAEPPEKEHHTDHLNAALADALRKWQPPDGTEVEIRFEATVAQNPGGIRDYHVVLVSR